jgi:hypothetical protein
MNDSIYRSVEQQFAKEFARPTPKPQPECPYCGATEGLRVACDRWTIEAPDYICADCFTPPDDGPCFDDLAEVKPAPKPGPSPLKAQLLGSKVLAEMGEFCHEIRLVYGKCGVNEMQAARDHELPVVRDLLTGIANLLGSALGAEEQLALLAGQMADAIDHDLRMRIVDERFWEGR